MDGRAEGQKGRKDERMEERENGRKEGQKDGNTDCPPGDGGLHEVLNGLWSRGDWGEIRGTFPIGLVGHGHGHGQ